MEVPPSIILFLEDNIATENLHSRLNSTYDVFHFLNLISMGVTCCFGREFPYYFFLIDLK